MGFITENEQSYYNGDNIGGYQYIPLADIINNFILMFTGEGKVIPKARRTEIQMHGRRAIQEFSYDIFKSYKSQEIELPPTLVMPLPHDYVNWVKISYIDNQGVDRPLYPTRITSNPSSILQDNNLDYTYDNEGNLATANESVGWTRNKANASDTNEISETGDPEAFKAAERGQRFGLDPEFANSNGGFYIDEKTGLIHFTGGLNGAIINIQYISDGNASDAEMVVHKFAEDAIYKYILYSIIAVTDNSQEYLVRRYKKSYVAAKRVAKIRLSNFKSTMMTQLMRGKSKFIKH
jgi:hypothetical protein